MNHRLFRTLALATSLGFLAGCQSVESRIKERPEAFLNASPSAQDKILEGGIDVGFTLDQVYLALGNPDEKRESINADGRSVTWIYNTYYSRYEGDQVVGYQRHVYFDPGIRRYRMYYRPAFVSTYSEHKEERIRVRFENGKVVSIDQTNGG
jgi:hypothetical protein